MGPSCKLVPVSTPLVVPSALFQPDSCRLLARRLTFCYWPIGHSAETLALMRRIDEMVLHFYPFYGSRQVARHLAREAVTVDRHRVRLLGLEAIDRRPRPP